MNYTAFPACKIFCYGPLLQAVQMSGLFNDSKTFVDMPLKTDPDSVLAAFQSLPSQDAETLAAFLDQYFDKPGSDLESWTPEDYKENPSILNRITDPEYRQWASDINRIWLVLGKRVSDSVFTNPDRHTFLPRPYPMIVPGGRFRESYYWDSWWIVNGLLACDMDTTALNVISNLLHDVDELGFVPNGGRIYYTDRSQPPFLSEMVVSYVNYRYSRAGSVDSDEALRQFVNTSFPLLEKEYAWWMSADNGHMVQINETYTLNRFFSNCTLPRPESFVEDFTVVEDESTAFKSHFYRNIRAGAETGWDFSTRWLSSDSMSLMDIDTSDIIPVDLNTVLYRYEFNMAKLAFLLDHWNTESTSLSQEQIHQDMRARWALRESPQQLLTYSNATKYYYQLSVRRKEAIQSLLWDESSSRWRDLNITSMQWSTVNTISSWSPLWGGVISSFSDFTLSKAALESLKSSGLLQVAGVLTTSSQSGQQWDSPNAWPPLVFMTIEGLRKLGLEEADSLAASLTNEWLNTGYLAYRSTGFMYEKYNAFEVGVGGGGGEYKPQRGFGWTNGVVLALMYQKYSGIVVNDDVQGVSDSSNGDYLMLSLVIAASVIVFVLALVVGYLYYLKRLKFNAWQSATEESEKHSEPNTRLLVEA